MAETKSLCAKISVELHDKVTQCKDENGLTLNEYVEQLITEYYQMKERTPNMATRTLALQISEELMERIKKHVDKTPHLTQKAFITAMSSPMRLLILQSLLRMRNELDLRNEYRPYLKLNG